jgi:hypothetical protein
MLQRLSPKEHTSAYPDDWEVGDASNLAVDNVAEMRSRAPHECRGLGQIQYSGDGGLHGLRRLFRLVSPRFPPARWKFFAGKGEIWQPVLASIDMGEALSHARL